MTLLMAVETSGLALGLLRLCAECIRKFDVKKYLAEGATWAALLARPMDNVVYVTT